MHVVACKSAAFSGFEFWLRLAGQADPEEKTDPRGCTKINETQVAPIDCIPLREIVEHVPPNSLDAPDVAKIGYEQSEKECIPDTTIRGCSQDQGFIQGLSTAC